MEELLRTMSEENDAYVVAQAARTHAQKAEEKAASLETALIHLKEHGWTKADHDAFWAEAKSSDRKVRHRLNVLLTFSAVALAIILAMTGWTIRHLDAVDNVTDKQILAIVATARDICESNNAQLTNTRSLYKQLAEITKNPDVRIELQNASADLPEPADCSTLKVRR